MKRKLDMKELEFELEQRNLEIAHLNNEIQQLENEKESLCELLKKDPIQHVLKAFLMPSLVEICQSYHTSSICRFCHHYHLQGFCVEQCLSSQRRELLLYRFDSMIITCANNDNMRKTIPIVFYDNEL